MPPTPPQERRIVHNYQVPGTQPLNITLYYNKPYFDWVTVNKGMQFPAETNRFFGLQVAADEVVIGRADPARRWFPDVDVAAMTSDSAVSVEHAMLRVTPNGDISVTDLGSKNGTYVGRYAQQALTPGEAVLVEPGSPIYLGAWTELVFNPS